MPWIRTRLFRSTSTLMRLSRWRGHELRRARGWGGHELRWTRGRNAFAVPPLALARGGSPGCETAHLRSCPPHPYGRRGSCPPLRARQHDDALSRLSRCGGWDNAGLLEEPPALFFHPARHAHKQGLGDVQLGAGGDDPAGDLVAARDSPEDVDEDASNLRVQKHHLQGVADALGVGATADVEKVGRLSTGRSEE